MNRPQWIKQWINDLIVINELFRDDEGKIDFEALGREEYQFRLALFTRNFSSSDRAKETYQQAEDAFFAKVTNGKKGGRPKKTTTADGDNREASQSSNEVPLTSAKISPDIKKTKQILTAAHSTVYENSEPTTSDIYDFARGNNLDEADARDWYEMTYTDRGGKDRNGNPITNWKAACRNFCIARANKRSEQ